MSSIELIPCNRVLVFHHVAEVLEVVQAFAQDFEYGDIVCEAESAWQVPSHAPQAASHPRFVSGGS